MPKGEKKKKKQQKWNKEQIRQKKKKQDHGPKCNYTDNHTKWKMFSTSQLKGRDCQTGLKKQEPILYSQKYTINIKGYIS